MPDVITITTETAVFAILIAAIVLVALAMSFVPRPKRKDTAADRFIAQLGLADWPDAVTSGLLLIFGLVGGSLLIGLLYSIWHIIWTLMTAGSFVDRSPFIALAALTGALGATIALPFTAIRLRHSAQQTETAAEALFNDKINAASTDLAARHQVTTVLGEGDDRAVITEWQDDLVTRAAAIDRLEGLVEERPDAAPRVARLLSVYVRELSAEYPAKEPHSDDPSGPLWAWADNLKPVRSDMEKAAQTLGRLRAIDGVLPEHIIIDLRGTNLQGFDLQFLNFKNARLELAFLDGANLSGANLEGAWLNDTQARAVNLIGARLIGADLTEANLEASYLINSKMQNATVTLTRLSSTQLHSAQLQGVILAGTRFDEMTSIKEANLRGACLRAMDLGNWEQIRLHLDSVFGDSSVELPETADWPAHWGNDRDDPALDLNEFNKKWRAWQATLDPPLDPVDPH